MLPSDHHMRAYLADLIAGAFVFLFVFGVHFHSSNSDAYSDPVWATWTGVSLLKEGDADLDEYAAFVHKVNYATVTIDGRLYYEFPIGSSLVAMPFLFIVDHLPDRYLFFTLRGYTNRDPHQLVHAFAAGGVVALAMLVAYALARIHTSIPGAACFAMVFAFGTSLWSTASLALWQHGPSVCMLLLTVYCLAKARENPRWVWLAGVPLAMAFVVRPLNAIPVVVLSAYVCVAHLRRLPGFLGGAGLVALPFLAYNWSLYGWIFSPYYAANRIAGAQSQYWEAVAANLVSPARGLLVYSPFLVLVPWGMFRMFHRGERPALLLSVALIPVIHLFVLSNFSHWWLGLSYGPRGMIDVLPFLMFLMLPFFVRDFWMSLRRAVRVLLAVFLGICILWSGFVHYRGANERGPKDWGFQPLSIDDDSSRVWDWKDPQFWRGLGD